MHKAKEHKLIFASLCDIAYNYTLLKVWNLFE